MRETISALAETPERHGWSVWPLLLLISVLLLAWLPAFVNLPPLDRDESRFAEASRQMVETGNYVDIRFASGPRYNKPIGIYWLQSLSAAIAGPQFRSSISVYRIPSLLAGLLCTILLYACARAIASRETALLSALLLGTSFLLTAESVIATTDAALLAAIVAAQSVLMRVYLAVRQNIQPPTTRFVMAGWLALGIGVLLKGPVILVVLAVTVIALSFLDRDIGWLRATKPLSGTVLAFAVVLPWAVAIGFASHGAFYEQSLGQDFAAKVLTGKESHGAPPGYYLVESVIAFWPATLVLIPALAWGIARRREALFRFLLAWSIGVWLVFEIVPTKLPHYVLPVYPALALICALWVDRDHMEGGQSSKAWRIASAILFLVGAAAAAAACIYLPMRYGGNVRAPLLFGAAIAGALACAAATTFLQTRFRQAVELALASAIAFDLVLGIVDVPQLRDLWLSPRAAELAAAERGPGNSPIVLTGYVEPSLVFLLGSDTRIAPARQAAAAISKGGLALVESRALPEFLAGAASLDVMTKPLGNVRGLDYSTGRNEQITLFRVMPAGH